jgi:hypothetical protein
MKPLLVLCAALVLFCQPASAGPKKLLGAFGQEVKHTFYTDFKEHPVSHGLSMAVRLGIVFSDTGSSCVGFSRGMVEVGPSRFLIGRHPNCKKAILATVGLEAIHEPAVNWLSRAFKASCDSDAANPSGKWWTTPSHTKSTEACYWGVQWADTLAIGTIEIPTIRNNVELLRSK